MSEEEWRDIPGYDGVYQASSLGRIRSNKSGSWRVLKQALQGYCKSKYRAVELFEKGLGKNRRVHQLVLEAFVGPRPGDGYQACHNDGDRENNALENLRWDTARGNYLDKRKHGTAVVGSKHKLARLTEDDVVEIRKRLLAGEKAAALAREYAVARTLVSQIKHRRVWTHV